MPSLLLGLTLLTLGRAHGEPRVDYTFQLVDVRPGCSDDDLGYPVKLVIQTTVVNQGDRPMILWRQFAVAPYYRLAASVEQLQRRQYEAQGGDLEIRGADVPDPQFGPEPDSVRFIVVPPGGRYSSEAATGFLAAKRPAPEERVPGFVLPGHHVIQVHVRPWPHIFMSTSAVERLSRRWQRIGDLVTEAVTTPVLEFELGGTMPRCEGQ